MHLLIVDTIGIQPYIFGSNRLRENVGASYLVKRATVTWAREALQDIVPNQHNWLNDKIIDESKRIEDGALDAELIYASGGNVVIVFRDGERARAFSRELSKKVLCEAPNLQLVIAHKAFEWTGKRTLPIDDVFKQLEYRKRHASSVSVPLLGLGVTARCRSTGLPAVGYVPEIKEDPDSNYLASGEVLAKWHAGDKANSTLQDAFFELVEAHYAFPREMDDLGRSEGEHSYIAVVHTDGNGIGQRIKDIRQAHEDDRAYIQQVRAFSSRFNEASMNALKSTLGTLLGHIDGGTIKHLTMSNQLAINLKKDGSKWLLPFRPIVFGGDDVTFVCDGRIGLSLALRYLEEFEKETTDLPDGRGKATACAGIAIVKAHHPFARAYNLSEALCQSAKGYRHELQKHDVAWNGSCLDWHFAFSGLYGSIETIREREYRVAEGDLTVRPVTLGPNIEAKDKTWLVLKQALDAFQSDTWLSKRNKMKALREALREGETEVERFCKMYGQTLPDVELGKSIQKTGWYGPRTPYFDAVELADWFIPLDGQGGSVDDA